MNIEKSGSSKPVYNRDDKKLRRGYVNLKKATSVELEELIQRQDKLLRSKTFVEKLPDKGKKILAFREEIQNELNNRLKLYNSTCDLLSNLNLNDSESVDFEWSEGRVQTSNNDLKIKEGQYSSDCETDPFYILVSHSGAENVTKNKIGVNSGAIKTRNAINYVNKMCHKYDAVPKPKERFKPNQYKESEKHLLNISSEKLKKRLGDKWEVTEATPPIFTIQNTQQISLEESIFLQKKHAGKFREMEKKHATEKLFLNRYIKMENKSLLINVHNYRNVKNTFDEATFNGEASAKEDIINIKVGTIRL